MKMKGWEGLVRLVDELVVGELLAGCGEKMGGSDNRE